MDRGVFVTGASRGIGAAIAKDLADRGYRVVGTALSTQNPQIRGVEFVECDVRNTVSVAKAANLARNVLGTVGVVVNSAGVMDDGLLVTQPPSAIESVIETNLIGSINVAREFIPDMMGNKWGRLIFIGSVVSHWGSPGQVNYAASKGGLLGVTRSLAWELGRSNITVNLVMPGLIETEMVAGVTEKRRQEILSGTPLRRTGTPGEVASTVSFLASDEASFITGASIPVTGGIGMGL